MENLDGIDRSILDILQENGRITNADLAARVGMSPPPVLERVRKLERRGYIKGYVALLDPVRIGCNTTVFVGISMIRHGQEALVKFWEEIEQIPEIMECYHIAGEEDYLLKVAVRDIEDYEKFVLHRLTPIENIARVRTRIVLSTVKHRTQYPLETNGNNVPSARGRDGKK